MQVEFRKTFKQDLRDIKDRKVLERIRAAIEEVENADSLLAKEGLASAVLEPDREDIRQKAERGLKAAFAISWLHLSTLHPSAQQLGRILSLFG